MGFAAVYEIYGLPLAERLSIVPPRIKDYQLSHGLLGFSGFTAPEKIILSTVCIETIEIYYKGKFRTQASRQLCQSRSMVQLTQPGRGSKNYI